MSAICRFQLGIIAGRINDRQTSGTVRRQSSSLYFLTIMLFAHRLIQFHRNFKKTRCNAKPDCSPPGYPSRRLLIIANWSVGWSACVQRSTCTSGRIPSQANPILWIEKMRPSSVYWCGQQNSSTVDLVYYTYDGRARRGWMHKVYNTLVTVTNKMCR